jgi:hypothetical protein
LKKPIDPKVRREVREALDRRLFGKGGRNDKAGGDEPKPKPSKPKPPERR